jgi:hypothetical protein
MFEKAASWIMIIVMSVSSLFGSCGNRGEIGAHKKEDDKLKDKNMLRGTMTVSTAKIIGMTPSFVAVLLILLLAFASCTGGAGENGEANADSAINDKVADSANKEAGADPASEISVEESDKIVASGDWLPIGSIVMLKDGDKRLMIIGKGLKKAESNGERIYDYCAVMSPEGLVSPNNMIGFDRDSIDRIYFLGYVDEYEDILNQQLEEYLAENREGVS